MSVKVSVRVRPFNKREQQLGSRCCIDMNGNTTHLIDPMGGVRSFVYDYSFWSHDKFMIDADGVTVPVDEKYADQMRVYQAIGADILVNAWEGYNCCLFAYGQTGSGKSYSMIGYGANRGIIPIVCDEMFRKMANNPDKNISFEVMISMMEIYNETIRDLLAEKSKKSLKVCQHKKLGVYVQGLEKHIVDSYQKIAKKIQQGSNRRSIAATLMNESSSRSHTIVSISFIQKIQINIAQTSIKYSTIHLIDLAGSECVEKTGAVTQDRLRETAKINQSLSTLGRVIQILADNCSGNGKQEQFVPYRDSKLTFILRNALGGNSRTAMICAISPSDNNYEQTLSTLRYANRAKNIRNKAIVNESDVDKLIRMLRQQNEMLKKMLQQAKFNKTVINYEMISNFNEMNRNLVGIGVVGVEDEENLLDQESPSKQDIISASEIGEVKNVDDTLPYITNVSEDELLSFRIKYPCEDLLIGNKHGIPKPKVVLTALGIRPHHARIFTEGGKVYIETLDEQASSYTHLNGNDVQAGQREQLLDQDRVIFGTGCVFMVRIKDGLPRDPQLKQADIDYQFAVNELQMANIEQSRVENSKSVIEEEEMRKQILMAIEKEYENNKRASEQQMRLELQRQQQLYHERIREIEERKDREAEKLLRELEAKETEAKQLEEEKSRIELEVEQFEEMQKELQLNKYQEKKELQEIKQTLNRRLSTVRELEKKLVTVETINIERERQVKEEIKRQNDFMQNQFVLCNNENRLNEYRQYLNKKMRHAKEVKDMLIRKEKNQLLKQLVELVPKVEQFNLMAKSMGKRVESGLSVQYKFISEGETIDLLKNSYKSQLRILIHVLNKDENRSYYWNTDIFRNRYELALEFFEEYLRADDPAHDMKFKDKELDPYWDPEKPQTIAFSFLSMESLLYNLPFSGSVSIISHGANIGSLSVSYHQKDAKGNEDLSIEYDKGLVSIVNPRDYIQKTIFFELCISGIELSTIGNYESIKIEYELLEANYKNVRYSTELIPIQLSRSFKYNKIHAIKEISQNTILHYIDKPITFEVQVIMKRAALQEELTSRSSFSTIKQSMHGPDGSNEKSLDDIFISGFMDVSPPTRTKTTKNSTQSTQSTIYRNSVVISKIDTDYDRHASQVQTPKPKEKEINMKKKKDKDCLIY